MGVTIDGVFGLPPHDGAYGLEQTDFELIGRDDDQTGLRPVGEPIRLTNDSVKAGGHIAEDAETRKGQF